MQNEVWTDCLCQAFFSSLSECGQLADFLLQVWFVLVFLTDLETITTFLCSFAWCPVLGVLVAIPHGGFINTFLCWIMTDHGTFLYCVISFVRIKRSVWTQQVKIKLIGRHAMKLHH